MSRTTLHFTPAQARALLHRLESWDCIVDVFADTDDLAHLADAAAGRSQELGEELLRTGELYVWVKGDRAELDREILREAVEGSTWPAIHDPQGNTDNTPQGHAGACRALWNAWERIADAYGLDTDDIDFPQA
jgi:hypothetical protein